jgi:peptidoglycan/xylan/chitin deacetylase (PgdA/CDA1 family)
MYLTFDDGPNKNTAGILDFLKANNLNATFFVLKPYVDKNPAMIKRMFNEGHTIGCHGVTHDKNKFYKSPDTALNEMKSCFVSIKNITGSTSNIVRTPYGSKPYMTDAYRKAMDKAHFIMWDWNIDSLDWKYNNAAQTIANTINQIKSDQAPLILMHDRGDTLAVLKSIMTTLKNKGYTAVAISPTIKPYNFWNKYPLQ